MIRVEGSIETPHRYPDCVAAALEPDNLALMRTYPTEGGCGPRSKGPDYGRSSHRWTTTS